MMSLYNRFRLLFLLVVLASVIASSALAFKLWGIGILDATTIQMNLTATEYLQQSDNDPNLIVDGPQVKIYPDWRMVPENIQQLFPLEQHQPGQLLTHGFSMTEATTEETEVTFFLPYKNTTGDGHTIYVYNRFKPNEYFSDKDHEVAGWVEILGLINLSLILLLGYRMESHLLKPIKALEKMAQRLKKQQSIDKLPDIIRDDEIGSIARPLKESVDTIHQYHLREKQFLESASHELRTSIAVTRSALDILEIRSQKGTGDLSAPVTQIRRANQNMTALTETLLNLAREGNDNPNTLEQGSQACRRIHINPLLLELVEDHRYLLKPENQVNINAESDCWLQANTELCRIVLSNLIRNAFEHSGQGDITIELHLDRIIVSNLKATMSTARKQTSQRSVADYGYGLGLAIVQKIAEKQGWKLIIDDHHPEEFQAELIFFE